jgi:hypothetical protein
MTKGPYAQRIDYATSEIVSLVRNNKLNLTCIRAVPKHSIAPLRGLRNLQAVKNGERASSMNIMMSPIPEDCKFHLLCHRQLFMFGCIF